MKKAIAIDELAIFCHFRPTKPERVGFSERQRSEFVSSKKAIALTWKAIAID